MKILSKNVIRKTKKIDQRKFCVIEFLGQQEGRVGDTPRKYMGYNCVGFLLVVRKKFFVKELIGLTLTWREV